MFWAYSCNTYFLALLWSKLSMYKTFSWTKLFSIFLLKCWHIHSSSFWILMFFTNLIHYFFLDFVLNEAFFELFRGEVTSCFNSSRAATSSLLDWDVGRLKFLCFIASGLGLAKVQEKQDIWPELKPAQSKTIFFTKDFCFCRSLWKHLKCHSYKICFCYWKMIHTLSEFF